MLKFITISFFGDEHDLLYDFTKIVSIFYHYQIETCRNRIVFIPTKKLFSRERTISANVECDV